MITQALIDRASALLALDKRCILGLVGAPGSGKSTAAARLAEVLGPSAKVVPMDGFHLAQAELVRLGRDDRKGAPDTFDAAGYVALLRRLREQPLDEVIYAPTFRRELEEPVAGAIPVLPETKLVITEGNYLLLDGPWLPVRRLLDESWFFDTPESKREAWLLARHMAFGRTTEEARAWIQVTDTPNARLILGTRDRADILIKPDTSVPFSESRG